MVSVACLVLLMLPVLITGPCSTVAAPIHFSGGVRAVVVLPNVRERAILRRLRARQSDRGRRLRARQSDRGRLSRMLRLRFGG